MLLACELLLSTRYIGADMNTEMVKQYRTLWLSLVTLRVGIAGLFMAHAVVRIFNGTIPRFAEFMGNLGFAQPLLVVWCITLFEIIGGVLLIVNIGVRYLVWGFVLIALGGIVLIHASFGWFVGEHGTGGSEYSVCLLLGLFVIGAANSIATNRKTLTVSNN